MPDALLVCSFCGKGAGEVRKMIAGPRGVYICDECVWLCHDILVEEDRGQGGPEARNQPGAEGATPRPRMTPVAGTALGTPPSPRARAARWIATCGGLGYAPLAPGTLTSLPVALLVWALGPADIWLLVAAAAVSAVGIWAAGREEARVGAHDPSSIVVDEVAGMLLALVAQPRSLPWVLALFLLFRVFDVWKPFPIRRLQDLPGGLGIVADDLLAGVYASVVARLAALALTLARP